jgi:hypothetical protein
VGTSNTYALRKLRKDREDFHGRVVATGYGCRGSLRGGAGRLEPSNGGESGESDRS